MSNIKNIQIPFALARHAVWQRKLVSKYETNKLIRALDTWLVLKHETRSGRIQDWTKQIQHLCRICKVSPTILRGRLKMLQDLQLVARPGKDLQVCSWQRCAAALGVTFKLSYNVPYDIDNPKQKLHLWIAAVEIADNQHTQEIAVLAKVNKNPNARHAITQAAIQAGADPRTIQDPRTLLTWMQIMYLATHVRASAIHPVLIGLRPDCNRSVYGIARAWCAKSAQTASYWKGKMQAAKVAHIGKIQLQSTERVRNAHVAEKWLPGAKQTFFPMCDNIVVLNMPVNTSNKNIFV